MKYKAINGWTKDSILKHIKENFKGRSAQNDYNQTCMYRGPEGRACAIGLFIPNELYTVELEGRRISTLLQDDTELKKHMPIDSIIGLELLQQAHDDVDDIICLQSILSWIELNVY